MQEVPHLHQQQRSTYCALFSRARLSTGLLPLRFYDLRVLPGKERSVGVDSTVVNVHRRADDEAKVIVEVHTPQHGLRITSLVRLLEGHSLTSFTLSTACVASNPHSRNPPQCLVVKINQDISDMDLRSLEQSLLVHYS
ncbi:hypothetical protein KP509_36G063700 [Ceratopteris richardii]|uniref:Uncharacterized protein n=1 Tax=Ceratopteris richardii TaxID=49495 RepID=A0A8T2QDY0_CERRI|nr:hypothetical protein KP509_36G063700 [Ceratopteris richardii]